MKAFTTIFAIGTLLSVTMASPVVHDINFEETALYTSEIDAYIDAHIDARQIPGLPPIAIPTKPGDVLTALQTSLKRVTAILALTQLGLPSAPGFPPLPALPTTDLPTTGLPIPTTGGVSSPTDILAQLSSIQGQIITVTSILNNLPAGTSLDQLKQALSIAGQIQSLATPIVDRVRDLGQGGFIPLPGNVTGVSSSLSGLLSLINFITFLLGPVSSIIPGIATGAQAAA
ncbi:hypothetical protein UCDDA912_g07244 [Diaporthe ampelina]|uniref:Uncharacterized protein n=1 Tax=Diaporthe ampelina TaxID=1214573 RepID=A0A0G2FDZ3_9PEZI|nr:hypothetical protein UCDDA912_g07244 [Diaporthe ampelina]